MPITQDRFIAIIFTAKKLQEAHEAIRAIVNEKEFMSTMSNANMTAEMTTDGEAKEAIRALLGLVNQSLQVVRDATSDISPTELGGMIQEYLHFSKVHRRNETIANQRKIQRAQSGIAPRQRYDTSIRPIAAPREQFKPPSYAETPQYSKLFDEAGYYEASKQFGIMRDLADIATGKRAGTLRPEDIKLLEKYWPEMLPKTQEQAQAQEPIAKATTLPTAPTPPLARATVAEPTDGTALLNDPDIISSSMPTLEQLNATADDPNADLL